MSAVGSYSLRSAARGILPWYTLNTGCIVCAPKPYERAELYHRSTPGPSLQIQIRCRRKYSCCKAHTCMLLPKRKTSTYHRADMTILEPHYARMNTQLFSIAKEINSTHPISPIRHSVDQQSCLDRTPAFPRPRVKGWMTVLLHRQHSGEK